MLASPWNPVTIMLKTVMFHYNMQLTMSHSLGCSSDSRQIACKAAKELTGIANTCTSSCLTAAAKASIWGPTRDLFSTCTFLPASSTNCSSICFVVWSSCTPHRSLHCNCHDDVISCHGDVSNWSVLGISSVRTDQQPIGPETLRRPKFAAFIDFAFNSSGKLSQICHLRQQDTFSR